MEKEKVIHYSRNPGFRMPRKHLPKGLLADLSAFVESESTYREARAADLAAHYGVSVQEILTQLEQLRLK